DAGAKAYQVDGPCGVVDLDGVHGTLTMNRFCSVPSMDLIALALDGNAKPIAYQRQAAVAFHDGGSFAVAGPWLPLTPVEVSVTGIPVTDEFVLWYFTNDQEGTYHMWAHRSGDPLHATLMVPPTPKALLRVEQTVGNTQHTFFHQVADVAGPHTVDLGASHVVTLGAPTLDLATAKLTVPSTTVDAYDSVQVRSEYEAAGGRTDWNLHLPRPGAYQLPILPASAGPVAPSTGWNTRWVDAAGYVKRTGDGDVHVVEPEP